MVGFFGLVLVLSLRLGAALAGPVYHSFILVRHQGPFFPKPYSVSVLIMEVYRIVYHAGHRQVWLLHSIPGGVLFFSLVFFHADHLPRLQQAFLETRESSFALTCSI